MKYIVSYCVIDGEAGSNPMWHSCILLSVLQDNGSMLEVVDNWGFYGLPSTNADNNWTNYFKKKIGLNIDLQGNHGWLRHEDIRYLDLGVGLHAVSFELSEELFKKLQNECALMVEKQEEAIKEIVESQHLVPKIPEETKIYPYEHLSLLLFELENTKANQQQRESRLKPFEVNFTMEWTGPSLEHSSTCKTQAINLLSKVLTEKDIARLTDFGKHPAMPRFSGTMEDVYLHSTGPLRTHKKASGREVYFRDLSDKEVRLFWSLPPQDVVFLSKETEDLFHIDLAYCQKIKSRISQLQQLEWLLIHADIPAQYEPYKQELITKVQLLYKSFSTLSPKSKEDKVSGLKGFAFFVLSWPRCAEEQEIWEKLKCIEEFFSLLGTAMDNHWQLEDLSLKQGHSLFYYEAIISYLSKEEKQKLCMLIGKEYEPEEELGNDRFLHYW